MSSRFFRNSLKNSSWARFWAGRHREAPKAKSAHFAECVNSFQQSVWTGCHLLALFLLKRVRFKSRPNNRKYLFANKQPTPVRRDEALPRFWGLFAAYWTRAGCKQSEMGSFLRNAKARIRKVSHSNINYENGAHSCPRSLLSANCANILSASRVSVGDIRFSQINRLTCVPTSFIKT